MNIRIRFLAVAAAVAFAGAGAAADDDFSFGTWWWSFASDAADVRARRLDWLAGCGVTEIYLSCPKLLRDGTDESRRTVADFVSSAGAKGIRVAALDGDVGWIRTGSGGFERAFAAFTNYQARVAPAERFYGMHLDIEPHQEEGYKDNETDALGRHWALVRDRIAPAFRATGWTLEFDTPFWWDERTIPAGAGETNLAALVASAADTVTLMSYRDTADAIYRCGEGEVPLAAAGGAKLVFGVETHSSEGDKVSFMEESQQIMFAELDALRATLRARHPGGRFGVAVHDVAHWEALRARTLPAAVTPAPGAAGLALDPAAGTVTLAIRDALAAKGVHYAVFAADTPAGPFTAVSDSAQAPADGMLAFPGLDAAAPARFFRIVASGGAVAAGASLEP